MILAFLSCILSRNSIYVTSLCLASIIPRLITAATICLCKVIWEGNPIFFYFVAV